MHEILNEIYIQYIHTYIKYTDLKNGRWYNLFINCLKLIWTNLKGIYKIMSKYIYRFSDQTFKNRCWET